MGADEGLATAAVPIRCVGSRARMPWESVLVSSKDDTGRSMLRSLPCHKSAGMENGMVFSAIRLRMESLDHCMRAFCCVEFGVLFVVHHYEVCRWRLLAAVSNHFLASYLAMAEFAGKPC